MTGGVGREGEKRGGRAAPRSRLSFPVISGFGTERAPCTAPPLPLRGGARLIFLFTCRGVALAALEIIQV